MFQTIEASDPALEKENLRCVTVKSPALRGRGDVTLWVPPSQTIDTVLILLHGVYNSHWAWSHKGGVHRVAQALLDAGEISPMVIAMPSDGLDRDGSAYLTFPSGQDVEKWIVDEVPAIAHLAAPSLHSNAKIAIGGFSMGGYGALRLGAKFPHRFNSVSAHSAITDIHEMANFVAQPLSEYLACAPIEELSAIYWIRKHCLDFDLTAVSTIFSSKATGPSMLRWKSRASRTSTKNFPAATNGPTGRNTLPVL
jgi:enterochelin esterase-like enzyme